VDLRTAQAFPTRLPGRAGGSPTGSGRPAARRRRPYHPL